MRMPGARSLLVAAIIALAFASSLVIIAGCAGVAPVAESSSQQTDPFFLSCPEGSYWADRSAGGAVRG